MESGAGRLNLCCAEALPDPPANDDCGTALLLGPGDSDTNQTITAAPDDVLPCGTTVQSAGAWYTFVGTGNEMTISLCDESTDYDMPAQR